MKNFNEKKIEFIPGYHEWQVIVDGNLIHAFDDFSEDIKENMTAEQVEALVDDLIYGWQMSFENDLDSLGEDEECPVTPIWETDGTELRKVMKEAICSYYGIPLCYYEVNTLSPADGDIETSNTFVNREDAKAFYNDLDDDEPKELLRVDEDGNIIEEIESNYND